jgi:hypothetical protein
MISLEDQDYHSMHESEGPTDPQKIGTSRAPFQFLGLTKNGTPLPDPEIETQRSLL